MTADDAAADNARYWAIALEFQPLVVTIARAFARFGRHGLTARDLTQEGLIEARRAVEMYDPSRGTTLKDYVLYRVRQDMNRVIRDGSFPVRIPSWLAKLVRRARRARDREAFVDSLPESRKACLRYATAADRPAFDRDAAAGPDAADLDLPDLLARLDGREHTVVASHYGLGGTGGQTLREIGLRLGCSSDHARQIEVRAMRKMRA